MADQLKDTMQNHELARHLACIEYHLMRWGWDAWDFELTKTSHLCAPGETHPTTR